MIPSEKILPTIMILIQIGCAVGYIPSGNVQQIVYWVAGSVLVFSITWL
jgi:hypothetical protein